MKNRMGWKFKSIALLSLVVLGIIGVLLCEVKPQYRNWLGIVTPICTIVGCAFACWKYADSVEMRRRDVLRRLLSDFQEKGYDATFYELVERENDVKWYQGNHRFLSPDYERRVDAMLRFFEDVLNMHKESGLISESELKYFEYYLIRISEHQLFGKYLSDLEEFCKTRVNPLEYVTAYVKSWKDLSR